MHMTVEVPDPELMSRVRGKAKRDLIAQAAVIPKQFDDCADRIRRLLLELKGKRIDEWEMVEAIHNEVFGMVHELGLTQLTAKLIAYQVAQMEYQRSVVLGGREVDLVRALERTERVRENREDD